VALSVVQPGRARDSIAADITLPMMRAGCGGVIQMERTQMRREGSW
jgi:hypothetical protein